MRKRYRVYLPKTIRWFLFPVFAFVWVIMSIATFTPGAGRERPDLLAWLMVTGVLLFVGVVIWAQTSGRWPVYVLEAEEEESQK